MDLCKGWSDLYLVGDLLIDGEHKKIIEMTCTFKTLVEQNRIEYREALELAREVAYHITTHFQHEEFLLEKLNLIVNTTLIEFYKYMNNL